MAERDRRDGRDRRDRDRDRGQVLVIFCLGIVALFAAAGLAFDVGRFYVERRFLQNAADAAALAAANALIRGESTAQADTRARESLTANFATPPNGLVPALPPATPVYDSGHAGDPTYLSNGILISGCDVRVAVQNSVGYTFGRVVGLLASTIGAQARAKCDGNLLPIAVRQYVNAPGPNPGNPSSCNGNQSQFMDFFATEQTSCLGTDSDRSLRTDPSPGSAFDASNPDSDPVNHGGVVTILGQGAQPSNGADFRGFVALDIRNFATTNQFYYNNITAGTTNNTLKSFEANWIANGGYPGPAFPPATTPPDPNDQVAVMSGNSTGVAITAVNQRFSPGDEVQVAVYPGITMAIPDFTLSDPGTISVPTTGPATSNGSFKASRNQAFTGTVALSTVADSLDPQNPMVTGALQGGGTPVSYTPNPVTPSLGSGQTVTMTNVATSGALTGIYTLWIMGQAGSPYLTTKYQPFALNVGAVSRDFVITANQSSALVANGGTATFTLNLKRSNTSFGGNVALSVDPTMPWGSLPSGLGATSFSSTSVSPTNGNGTSVTFTVNAGTVAPGDYTLVVRASGTNGDGQRVTHLLPLKISVGTAAGSGNQEYVDIVGFAVMRIAYVDSNHVDAYAITPVITDPSDSRLSRGQVARLVPWS
ncbi:MAG TPA: pilus assembly protein TadG-related protein [Candidatus Limnocylindrales bacterium]|nr:pilus assembly protein TadG-related protein [Candidatus Limnocylindrales bacterium]